MTTAEKIRMMGLVEKPLERVAPEDWMQAPLADEEVGAVPKVPVVRAGDGGAWVPVFVYVPRTT